MDVTDTVLVVPDAFAIIVGGVLTVAIALLVMAVVQRQRLAQRFAGLVADIALTEDVTGLGYWSRGIDDTSARWSPGMYRLFGVDPATFKPTREAILAKVHPDDLPAFGRIASPEASGGRRW